MSVKILLKLASTVLENEDAGLHFGTFIAAACKK